MIRQYVESEETERLAFARKAAKHFESNIHDVTFSDKGPQKGELFALRWGLGNDCVVVFKICEYGEIINYCQFIDRGKAELCTQLYRKATGAAE